MAKTSSIFICQQCGYQSPQFLGKCPECNTWNSFIEEIEEREKISNKNVKIGKIVQISDIEKQQIDRISTTNLEFDTVLGGGIVKGSVILVAGDPGIGKSTLLTQLALNVSSSHDKLITNNQREALYIAGEESAQQIKLRVDRITKKTDLSILSETDVDVIIKSLLEYKPKLVIVDSIQSLQTQDLDSAAGSVSQVRESAYRLQKIAKSLHIPIFLVGHITKEGTIAGPKTLEHLVDVVLTLEGDPTSNFRILRANKNRFGTTDEVGIFDITEAGLKEVSNPSKLFIDQKVDAPGSAVVATLTGLRPMLVEVQALVTKSSLTIPRRVSLGLDVNRLQLLVAVLTKRANLALYDQDIFVNLTGGIKVTEPAIDLAVCLAIISSFIDKTLSKKTVIIGEVGLLGDLRSVRQLNKRITEAKKLGFNRVVTPENARTIKDAIKLAFDN